MQETLIAHAKWDHIRYRSIIFHLIIVSNKSYYLLSITAVWCGDSFTYAQKLLFTPLSRERILLNYNCEVTSKDPLLVSLVWDILSHNNHYSYKFSHLIAVSNSGYFSLDIADWFTTLHGLVHHTLYIAYVNYAPTPTNATITEAWKEVSLVLYWS
jgi:hypothetical protein